MKFVLPDKSCCSIMINRERLVVEVVYHGYYDIEKISLIKKYLKTYLKTNTVFGENFFDNTTEFFYSKDNKLSKFDPNSLYDLVKLKA